MTARRIAGGALVVLALAPVYAFAAFLLAIIVYCFASLGPSGVDLPVNGGPGWRWDVVQEMTLWIGGIPLALLALLALARLGLYVFEKEDR